MPPYKPIVLVVLDGWGENPDPRGNALLNANLPVTDSLSRYYPKISLQASGLAVGLPWLQEGNSEIGHQTMGTGQVIFQNLPRITQSIGDGSFFENEVLLEAMRHVRKHKSRLHLMGLTSDGGVHSHIDHLFALMELARWQEISDRVFIHAITDGRDTPIHQGHEFLSRVQAATGGHLATICGRYYTMDRNKNWDRVQKGYDAMVKGEGIKTTDPLAALKEQYADKTDEYIKPIIVTNQAGQPLTTISDNDALIFFNFRPDRARQISHAFTDADFRHFPIHQFQNLKFITFTEYEKKLPVAVAFPPQTITQRVSALLSQQGLKQLKIAETEKYAHVTYFFNGGIEKPFDGEKQVLIPSKNAPSYADVPQMSAAEITQTLLQELRQTPYDFVLVNYANPDMVGHTGDFKAGIKAVEIVDAQLKKLIPAILEKNGCLLITADHGNVEEMTNIKSGEIDTQHSNFPVPCWLVTPDNKKERQACPIGSKAQGMLLDVPATILELLGLKKPADMRGMSLLKLLQ